MDGSLYQGSKPVMWSPVEKTALAEAEVEYHDHTSHTIWVRFPVIGRLVRVAAKRDDGAVVVGIEGVVTVEGPMADAVVLIWTTTPWTIPQNRAVAFNPAISYGLYEVGPVQENATAKPGEKLLLADALADAVMASAKVESHARLRDVSAEELSGLMLAHPLRGVEGGAGEWAVSYTHLTLPTKRIV